MCYGSLYSQVGEVVISEENIQRLAYKLYELKLERNATNKSFDELDDDIELKIQIQKYNIINDTLIIVEKSGIKTIQEVEETIKGEDLDTAFVYKEKINDAKESAFYEEHLKLSELILQQLDTLSARVGRLEQRKNSAIETFEEVNISPSSAITPEDLRNQFLQLSGVIAANQAANQRSFSRMNTKLDSLIALYAETSSIDTIAAVAEDSLSIKQDSILQLEDDLQILEKSLDTMPLRDTTFVFETQFIEVPISGETKYIDSLESAYKARVEKYESFSETIYFENNSIAIQDDFKDQIMEIITILDKEDKVDVMIEGYASNTGSVTYNQEISLRRAVALKTFLMEKGIPPKRILTDYKGIDYEAETPAEARRLDVRFVIRK